MEVLVRSTGRDFYFILNNDLPSRYVGARLYASREDAYSAGVKHQSLPVSSLPPSYNNPNRVDPDQKVAPVKARQGRPAKAKVVGAAPVQKTTAQPAAKTPAPATPSRTSKYVPKHGVCPVTGRALNADGSVRAVRGSKKAK